MKPWLVLELKAQTLFVKAEQLEALRSNNNKPDWIIPWVCTIDTDCPSTWPLF